MKKKLLWAFVSLVIAGLTVWAVASSSRSFSPQTLWNEIRHAHKGWFAAALLAMFGFIFFEGMAIVRVTTRLGYRKSPLNGTVYGASDVYFSASTPSASGGQPVCAWFMIRDGIPGAVTTVTLLITLVMYTLALLLSGIVVMLLCFPVFLSFSQLARVMILLGSCVLLFLGLFFLLLLRRPKILHRICGGFLHFLEKIHLMRGAKRLREKLNTVMEEYSLCSKMLFGKNRMLLLESFFWNLCQRLSYFLVTFLLFMAVGRGTATGARATAVQCLSCVGSNCIPIPGAMGAADYMLLDGFGRFLPEDSAVTMEMLCRGITFYGSVFVGLLIVIIGYFAGRRKKLAGAEQVQKTNEEHTL